MAEPLKTTAEVALALAGLAVDVADILADKLQAAEKAAAPDPREVVAFLIAEDGAVTVELAGGARARLACETQARALLDAAALGGAAAARPGARLRRCDYTDDAGRRRTFYAEVNR